MNKLIKTHENEQGNILVSGRDLHEFLEVSTQYSKWFERMTEYGFALNIDFVEMNEKVGSQKRLRTYEQTDHHMTTDMAKEIAMIQRSDKGKQARQYFLELERKWNSPDAIIERSMQILRHRVENLTTENLVLTQRIGELKPKADYTDDILKNKGLVTMTQIAKDYGMSANTMNQKLHELGVQFKQSKQWLLYSKYQDKGYTHSETITITRSDGRPDVRMNTKWTQKGRLFIYDLLKHEGILPKIEITDEQMSA